MGGEVFSGTGRAGKEPIEIAGNKERGRKKKKRRNG
jgi:hypothetical protein